MAGSVWKARAERFGWLAVFAGMLAVIAACGGDEEAGGKAEALAALDRGWAAYAQGETSAALAEFERAANLDGTLPDAHNGVGWARLRLVEGAPTDEVLDLAIESFTQALRADGDFADAWVGLGEALFLRRTGPNGLLDAARAFAAARSASPKSLYRHDYDDAADIYALEGWCYYYAGDVETARARADDALRLRSDLASARLLKTLAR